MVRSADGSKTFGRKGNYITTVVYTDLPHFPDSIAVDNFDDSIVKSDINFSSIKFFGLSSAFAVSYRIDLDANAVTNWFMVFILLIEICEVPELG